jgi:MFS transporter, DHA1 family, multidrug resistance protein
VSVTVILFLIQVVLQYSVVAFGHIALLLGFGYFFGNTLSRILVNYFSPLHIAGVGMIGALVSSLVLVGLGIFVKLNLLIVVIPVFILFANCGLIFPNVAGIILNLFRTNAGIVSAVMGTLQVGGVFILSSLAALLKTNSQMHLALLYVAIMVINLCLFWCGSKMINRAKQVVL